MQTGTRSIQVLMNEVSQGQLRLPEIQRAYVWKPAQVAGLIDSLYRRYPSGSLLLWKTSEEITDRPLATTTGTSVGLDRPTFLLDGQQRITSLHRVYTGHDRANVVFNPAEEKFQVSSAATRRDPRWVSVHGLLSGELRTFALAQSIAETLPDLSAEQVHERLERVRKIGDYQYYFEILDDLPYLEVTQVFVRVNSRGRALKETDLALATLSARWPGAVARFQEQADWCQSHGYNSFDQAFLVRCLAALAVDSTSPGGFATVEIERLEAAWSQLERGLHHTVNLLQDEVQIDNSRLIPSDNALVPIVYWLGTRPDLPLGEEERKTLIYWLLVSFIESRYSASAASTIAQDVAALRSDRPLEALYRNLGLLTHRPAVTPDRLAGKGSTSPFFLFSYLAARRARARDWWYGLPIRLSHDGSYKVEYHHIHPQARLKERYAKAEINDLANLAFISDKANRKISARSPESYFADPAFDASDLTSHFVPTEADARSVEAYPVLLQRRRALLAAAMNDLLESDRPAFLDDISQQTDGDHRSTLSFQAYGAPDHPDSMELRYQSAFDGATASGYLVLGELVAAISDLADGRGAEVTIDGEAVALEPTDNGLALPLGPFLVAGELNDWNEMIGRELRDALPDPDQPAVVSSWTGDRVAFLVSDSD